MEPRHTKPLKTQRSTKRTVQRRVRGTEKTEKPGEKAVEFVLHRPEAQSVALAGTFNNWDPQQTPLSKDAQGIWKVTVSLRPGRYEYRFVADAQWFNDPNAQASVPNNFGSINSVVLIAV